MSKKYLPYLIIACILLGIGIAVIFSVARIIVLVIGVLIIAGLFVLGLRKVFNIGKSSTPRD